jgi:hypothetical protein
MSLTKSSGLPRISSCLGAATKEKEKRFTTLPTVRHLEQLVYHHQRQDPGGRRPHLGRWLVPLLPLLPRPRDLCGLHRPPLARPSEDSPRSPKKRHPGVSVIKLFTAVSYKFFE